MNTDTVATENDKVMEDDKVTRRQGDKVTQCNTTRLRFRLPSSLVTLSPFHLVTLSSFLVLSFLAGCGGANKPATKAGDTELSQQLSAARAAFNRGAYPQAASLYGLALKRAEEMDDAGEIANAAYNDAATLMQTGKYDDARAVLSEARIEAKRVGAATSDIAALEARVARLQKKLDDAVALADEVLSDKSAAAVDRLSSELVKGLVAVSRGDVNAAREGLARARAQVGQGTSPTFAAGMMELDGRIALLNKEYPAAAERFDKEAGFLREAKLYADMVRALARAGKAYADASQPAPAADRYYRAARSAAAQNDPIAGELLDAAEKLGDAQIKSAIGNLRRSLPATRPSIPPGPGR